MKPSLLVVIPTYGAFDYAALAVDSVLRNTQAFEPFVLVVDDASPTLKDTLHDETKQPADYKRLNALLQTYGKPRCTSYHFRVNGGLTRSWNYGLTAAAATLMDYACVTNSDVYFPPGWDHGILAGLEKYALVGPVTNAPGTETGQYVGRYSLLYAKHQHADFEHIERVQRELLSEQQERYREMTLNGFCLIAKTATWFAQRYDSAHVFRPRNDYNSKGQPNPTPLMTLNEYELQGRWRDKGLQFAACLSSYVFHYRAVSRGEQHRRGDWARLKAVPKLYSHEDYE